MHKLFSLAETASRFDGDLAFLAALPLEEARQRHTVGSTAASSAIHGAIAGALLSRDQEARSLLTRFRPWLIEGLSQREWLLKRNGSSADEARWNDTLSLYDWLIGSHQNVEALSHAFQHWFGWYQTDEGQKWRGEIGSLFAIAIDAGCHEQIIDLYGRPLTSPLRASKATNEAGFGNYLAHRLLQGSVDAATENVFDRFLSVNMHKNWLSRGHYKTAAHWLKLRFWNFADPKPEPFAVVRRALDYIPEEARQLSPGSTAPS